MWKDPICVHFTLYVNVVRPDYMRYVQPRWEQMRNSLRILITDLADDL